MTDTMNSKNSLHDTHLKKALEHAPDSDAQPSANVRNKVLGYAKNTVVKQAANPRDYWLNPIKNWLLKDHFANAQWAGLTGLAAVLLVSIILWREHPEDLVGIGDAPASISEKAEIAQAPLEAATDAAQKEIAPTAGAATQADAALNQAAPAEVLTEDKVAASVPPQAEAKLASQPKPVIVGQSTQLKDKHLAEKTETDKLSKRDAESTAQSSPPAKKEIAENMAVPEVIAPIEAAPAPTVIAAPSPITVPASPPASSDAALEAAPSKNKAIIRSTAQAKTENATEGNISTNNDADFGRTHQDENRRQLTRNKMIETNPAKTLLLNGGKATANADIKASSQHLLKVVTHGDANKTDCVITKTLVESIDERSGLRVENIDVCTASEQLLKEVEFYNKTVLDWYFQYQGE